VKDCRRIAEGLYEEYRNVVVLLQCDFMQIGAEGKGGGTSMLVSCHQIAGQRFMKNADVAGFRRLGVKK
jgi:hypothetical protein